MDVPLRSTIDSLLSDCSLLVVQRLAELSQHERLDRVENVVAHDVREDREGAQSSAS
jgi:hypothetical protein